MIALSRQHFGNKELADDAMAIVEKKTVQQLYQSANAKGYYIMCAKIRYGRILSQVYVDAIGTNKTKCSQTKRATEKWKQRTVAKR